MAEASFPAAENAPEPVVAEASTPAPAPASRPAEAPAKSKAKDRAVAAAPAREPTTMTRREFFPWVGAAWAVFTAAFVATLGAMTRFMFPNVLFEPPSSFKAGFPEEYVRGVVDERFKEKFGTWIVRNDEGIYALSTTCTHLGCTPNWLQAENKFKCPCHGSGFYKTGINFEGPAPRPLERYRIVMSDDGQILIDKSKKFQQEKGQWTDPEAFLKVV